MKINLKFQLLLINSIIVIVILIFSTMSAIYLSKNTFDDLSEKINLQLDKNLDEQIEQATSIVETMFLDIEKTLVRDSRIISETTILKNAFEYEVIARGELVEDDDIFIQRYRKIRPFIDYRLIAGMLKENFYYSQNAKTHIEIYSKDGDLLGSTVGVPEYVINKVPKKIIDIITSYHGYLDTYEVISSEEGISFKAYQKIYDTKGIVGVSTPLDLNFLQQIKNITGAEVILYNGPKYFEGTIFKFGSEIEYSNLGNETEIFNELKKNKKIVLTGSNKYPDKLLDLGLIDKKRQIRTFRLAYLPLKDVAGEVVGMVALALSSSNLERTLEVANLDRLTSNKDILTMFIIVAITSLFIAMFLIYQYAKTITIPISTILSIILKVSKGDLECESNILRNDEIGELSSGINHMIISLKEIDSEKQKRKISEELRDINFKLSGILDKKELIQKLFQNISDYTKFDSGYIVLSYRGVHDVYKIDIKTNKIFVPDDDIVEVILSCLVQFKSYSEPVEDFSLTKDILSNELIDNFLYIPLIRDDNFKGCILLGSKDNKDMFSSDIDMIFSITSQSVSAIENAILFEEINNKTLELATYFEKLQSIRDTVIGVYAEKDIDSAIDFILKRVLDIDKKLLSCSYYEYRTAENTLVCNHFLSCDTIINKNAFGLLIDNEIRPDMFLSLQNHKIQIVPCKNNNNLDEYIIPIYNEDINIGVILIEAEKDSKNQIDILNIVSQNLSLYIENQRNHESFFNSEKMNSLLSLVTGIAHEMNTPVGVCITSSTYLNTLTKSIIDKVESGHLKKSELDTFLNDIHNNQSIITRNLEKTANLINSFKKISVGDIEQSKDSYNLKDYMENLVSLNLSKLELEHNYTIDLKIDDKIFINHNRLILKDIIEKIIENSIIHGFEKMDNGIIKIDIKMNDNMINFAYSDNGSGIERDNINKIFDPFYTTRRGRSEGFGLGLNHVYNLVIHNLKGRIRCESEIGVKTTFIINFPAIVK